MSSLRAAVEDGIAAGLYAALPSGLPSTVHALATGRDPLEAARAAGTIVLPDDAPGPALLAAAAPLHLAVSAGWGIALAAVLPRRATTLWGAFAGAAIGVLDLGIARSLWPRIAALPQRPQLADHVAFGAIAGAVIARRREREKKLNTVRN